MIVGGSDDIEIHFETLLCLLLFNFSGGKYSMVKHNEYISDDLDRV